MSPETGPAREDETAEAKTWIAHSKVSPDVYVNASSPVEYLG